MQLRDLDRAPSGNMPLTLTVRWLRTLLQEGQVLWAPGQKLSAAQAVQEAEALLGEEIGEFRATETLHSVRTAYERYKLKVASSSYERELKALQALRDELAFIFDAPQPPPA